MENLILIVILVLIIGSAIAYIVKEKKKGVRCIGCPAAGKCGGNHGDGGCASHDK